MDVDIIVVPIIHSPSEDQKGTINCEPSEASHQLLSSELAEKLKQFIVTHLSKKMKEVKHKPLALLPKKEKVLKSNRLTPRENEVLLLTAKGLTQKEVAQVLTISPTTVGGYKKEIYRKLEVSTAAEAAAKAVKYGIILP